MGWFVDVVVGHAPDQKLADTLVAGLRNHVRSLQSGIVEFQVFGKGGRPEARRFVAFDAENERIRSDTVE